MHVREFDFRIDPLENIIVGIDAGITAVQERLEVGEFDGLGALEHVESLIGLGFVAFQTYALGTWTDLNEIRKSRGKPVIEKKLLCYKCDPIIVQGGVTRIELINAIANYFKHHDEWPQWPTDHKTEALGRVGITQQTEFPCVEVARLFCGRTLKLIKLIVLHQVVQEWRTHVLKTLG